VLLGHGLDPVELDGAGSGAIKVDVGRRQSQSCDKHWSAPFCDRPLETLKALLSRVSRFARNLLRLCDREFAAEVSQVKRGFRIRCACRSLTLAVLYTGREQNCDRQYLRC